MFDPNNCSPKEYAAIKWALETLYASSRLPDDWGLARPVLDKWHKDNVLAMVKVKE